MVNARVPTISSSILGRGLGADEIARILWHSDREKNLVGGFECEIVIYF